MVLLEEVITSATEYEKITTTIQTVKNEMKQVRETYAQRLDPLIKRQEELETIILQYLTESNLPGVKLGGVMFVKEEIPCFSSREQKIEQVLKTEPPGTHPDVLTQKIIKLLRQRVPQQNIAVNQKPVVGPDGETKTRGTPAKFRLRMFQR